MGTEDKYWGSRGGGNYDTRHQGINCYNIYMQNNGGLSQFLGENKEMFWRKCSWVWIT